MNTLTIYRACSDYLLVDRAWINILGIKAAVVLSELVKLDRKINEDFFEVTSESLQTSLNISDYEQRTVIKQLVELDIIQAECRGMPAKRFIKINYTK